MLCPSPRHVQQRTLALALALSAGLAMLPGASMQAHAAEFSISPISLELPPGVRSSAVGIRNADKRPLRFQLSLVEWTQDAQGNDVYTPSDDLIYFPRQLTVRPGDRSIARIGPKGNNTGDEKTYRLRIEELPEAPTDVPLAPNGAYLKLLVSFAVPVFQGKPDAIPVAVIAPMHMQNGELNVTVKNAGHSHFRIDTLEVTSANGYSQRLAGWYLLAGASRPHSLTIAPAACREQRNLNLTVKVGDHSYTSELAVDPSMCGT